MLDTITSIDSAVNGVVWGAKKGCRTLGRVLAVLY